MSTIESLNWKNRLLDRPWQQQQLATAINFLIVVFAFSLPISSNVSRLAIYLTALLWLLQGGFREKFLLLRQSPALILYAAYISILLLSLAFSESSGNGFWREKYSNGFSYVTSVHIKYFLIAIFVYTVGQKKYLMYALYAYLCSMFVCEVISFGMAMDLLHLRMGDTYSPTPFMHYIFFSIYLNIALFLAIGLLSSDSLKLSGRAKIALWVFILSTVFNLLILPSRLGYLALIGGLILVALLHRRKFKKLMLVPAMLLGLVFIATLVLHPGLQQRAKTSLASIDRLLSSSNDKAAWESSIGARAALNIAGISYLADHPSSLPLGVGMGDARKKLNQYVTDTFPAMKDSFSIRAHVHNQYLQLVIDGGLLTLGIVLAMFYFASRLQAEELPKFAVLLVVTYLLYSIGEIPLQRAQPLSLFGLFLGILLALERFNRNQQTDSR